MLDNIHYSFLAMVYLLIAIFWGIYGRVDMPTWSALTVLVCVLNVLLMAVPALKRKNKKPSGETIELQQQHEIVQERN